MTGSEDFWTTEHNHESQPHRDYKPKPCRLCWGDSAEPEPKRAANPPLGEAPMVRPEARSLAGFTSLGDAIAKIRARRGEVEVEAVEYEAPRSPIDDYPYCETCKGTRIVRIEVGIDHPDFGKGISCPTCGHGIVMQQRLNKMFGEVPEKWHSATLDNFDTRFPGQRFVLDKVNQWVVDAGPRSLYLWSPSGRGKSHLAVALLHRWIELGHSGTFKEVGALLDTLKAGFDTREGDHLPSYYAMMQALKDTQLVLLDDLGSEHHRSDNDWATSELFKIVNARYEANERMIVTSNYSLQQLNERMGHPRTASRLFEMCKEHYVIDMSRLPDYRLIQGKAHG